MNQPPNSEHGLNGFERRRRIYAALSKNPEPTPGELATRFGVSESLINSDIRRIKAAITKVVAEQAAAAGVSAEQFAQMMRDAVAEIIGED